MSIYLSSKHFQKYLLFSISTYSTQRVLILYKDTTNTTIYNEYIHMQRFHMHTTSTNSMQRVLTRYIEYLLYATCTYSIQRVLLHTMRTYLKLVMLDTVFYLLIIHVWYPHNTTIKEFLSHRKIQNGRHHDLGYY